MKGDIGVIGLAVMGQNLILNMNDNGFKVVAHNRTAAKVDEFLEGPAKGTNIVGAYSLEELVEKLETPRKVMLMVRAGAVVDTFIDNLIPLLDEGDIIIDGGNTNYPDTNRRVAHCREKGIHFIGTGVSGGEEGARFGPSIMPGGAAEAWEAVKLSSKVSLQKLTLANLVVTGLVTTVRVTSLRWYTTVSNTVTCS
ncbi:6-phosphogluconate dehydrogenase decarboxylating [Vibrio astriarenae]|nr:6-phosphogluconate dehydrogenase decarboxylating [Vibrio sp. C7]